MQELNETIKIASENARYWEQELKKNQSNEEFMTVLHNFNMANKGYYTERPTRIDIGRVTVYASMGGNTCGHKVRLTFQIDGKRASRAAVEKLFK